MRKSHHPKSIGPDRNEEELAQLVEELSRRIEHGESSRVADLLDENPDHELSLREILPTLEALAEFENELAEPSQSADGQFFSGGEATDASIGDFRLVREIGRGGMGVVYEAYQLSMQRTVALKVLPFAALAGEKTLKRFHNEVRAAALLDHPHIVSVYSVGEDRGIHHYAMQYVRGRSLAAVIAELRADESAASSAGVNDAGIEKAPNGTDVISQDVRVGAISTVRNAGYSTTGSNKGTEHYRNVARLGIQAAEALQHAHDQGVIHRDIKPGNLLLDASGKIRVTDFGLANIENDVNLTATGELIGTLRYMSPEQALGSRAAQDHRSDIFSLGATLYELLTLQPVITGVDRGELLDQIRHKQPRPPRQIDSKIPADLETILLKALEKEPADRYQSAQQLADDLKRFNSGHTIQAKRPSSADRLVKWARRNVALVGVSAAIMLVLCVVLAASTLLVARAKTNTQQALEKSRQHADESRQHAEQVEDLLYAADIQLAYQAWDAQRPNQADQILNRHIPAAGERDRRGYEWELLKVLTRQPQPRVPGEHDGDANELAVFPAGDRIASVGNDGKLCIWEVDSGELLKTIDTGSEPLHAVAISPDGQTIATGGHRVQLWDVASGDREMLLTEHEHTVEAIAFSRDGERIATGSRYHEVRMFSKSGQLLKTVKNESRHVTLEFTAVGDRLLVPGKAAGLRIWDADLSVIHRTVGESILRECDLATASPSGAFYLISDQHRLKESHTALIHAATGKELFRFPTYPEQVETIKLSPDERIVAIGFSNGSVHYAKLGQNDSGQIEISGRVRAIDAHHGAVKSLQFVQSDRIVTCGRDGAVKSWQLSVANNPRRGAAGTQRLAIAPSNGLVASIQASELRLHSTNGDVIHKASTEGGWIRYNVLAFSPDGRFLATCNDTHDELRLRDARTCNVLEALPFDSYIERVAFHPAGDTLAVCTYANSTVHFLDLQSMQVLTTVPLGSDGRLHACQFSQDGQHFVCGGGGRGLVVFDATSYTVSGKFPVPSEVSSLVLCPAQKLLVTGHEDGKIQLWDFPNLHPRETLVAHEDEVRSLAFHPDGDALASASDDGTLRLWSITLKREWGVLDRSEGGHRYLDVAFSDDGHWLYAGRQETPGLAVFSLSTAEQEKQRTESIDWEYATLPFATESKLADAGHDFSVDATGLLVSDYELHQIDVDKRELIDVVSPFGQPWPLISAAKDCPRVALADEQQVVVYDYQRHAQIASWAIDQHPHQIDFSPNGQFVALARSKDGEAIELLDVNDPSARESIPVKRCSCLRFATCSAKLAAGRQRQLVILEKSAEDRWSVVRKIDHESNPYDVAISPDGYTLASAGSDRRIRNFDSRTGHQFRASPQLKEKLTSIDFSPCGQLIASGGSYDGVKIWQAERIKQLHVFPASGWISKLRFALDDYQLFARTRQGTLVTFDVGDMAKAYPSEIAQTGRGASLIGLGRPGGAKLVPRAVSEDGQRVVGSAAVKSRNTAFQWSPSAGTRLLPMPKGYGQSYAMAIGQDANGEFVAGQFGTTMSTEAGIWRAPEQPPVMFSQPHEWRRIYITGVDGNVMVGKGDKFDVRGKRALIYDGNSIRALPGQRDGYQTLAHSVSQDGKLVLGISWKGSQLIHSARCRDARIVRWLDGKPEFLPGIKLDAPFNWRVAGMSKDGQVVVGSRWPFGGNGSYDGMAFRWEAGKVQLLGDLPGRRVQSYANGVSADGGVIVGRSDSNEGRRAFIWDTRHGMRRLDHVLAEYGENLKGWRLTEARVVSADGRTIAGIGYNRRGKYEAWVATLPDEAFE